MILKFIKFMIKTYFMNKFYIWICNWVVSVKHASSFSSTFDYQQSQGSNNPCFFTLHYPLTVFTTTSAIKSVTSPALFTAVVPTVISNHASFTFGSCVQSPLNKTEKQHYHNNNLCFYCDKSNHWLNNCFWKHTTCINKITFQTPSSKQLIIKASSVSINASEL